MGDPNEPKIELDGSAPVTGVGDAGGSESAAGTTAAGGDRSDAPDTVGTKVSDLPESNAIVQRDQSKVTGAPETDDYRKNPPQNSPTVVSTHDRDSVQAGPESIGAGGPGNPSPGPGSGDGLDSKPRGNPDAPQGTGPEINERALSGREANGVLGEVRQSRRASEK